MFSKTGSVLLLSIFFLSGFFTASSQNLTKSPYSVYGPGEPVFQGFAQYYAMGQLSQGFRSPLSINFQNPASYSGLVLTTFEAGGLGSVGKLSSATSSQKFNTASFGYLALGFPVWYKKGWGGTFGLLPYSTVGYNIRTEQKIGDQEAVARYEGRGGLSRFYIGNGIRLYKTLHAGFNASYIFGQINTTKTLTYPLDLNYFNYAEDRDRFAGGFSFDAGLQFRDTISRSLLFTLGAKYSTGGNLDATQRVFSRTFVTNNSIGLVDTVFSADNLEGKMVLPSSLSVGLGLERPDTFMVGADVTLTSWENFRSFNSSDSLRNNISVSVGGYWIPDVNADKGYFKKIQYMAGLRFQTGYLNLNNTLINEYGASVGFGLPLNKKRSAYTASKVNVSFEYFRRGSTENGLIREDHYRIAIGFTLNERWFIRRKFL